LGALPEIPDGQQQRISPRRSKAPSKANEGQRQLIGVSKLGALSEIPDGQQQRISPRRSKAPSKADGGQHQLIGVSELGALPEIPGGQQQRTPPRRSKAPSNTTPIQSNPVANEPLDPIDELLSNEFDPMMDVMMTNDATIDTVANVVEIPIAMLPTNDATNATW